MQFQNVDWAKMTLPLLIEYSSARYRDELMWIHEDNRFFSYDSLMVLSSKVAGGLENNGFMKGDHVGILLPDFPEWCFIFFGVTGAGGVAVPINLKYTPGEIKYVLKQSDCNFLICPTEFHGVNYIELLEGILPGLGESRDVSKNIDLPRLKKVMMLDGPALMAPNWAVSFDFLMGGCRGGGSFPDHSVRPGDPASIQYDPGTASLPEGVVLTHGQVAGNAYLAGRGLGLRPGDRYICTCPLYFRSGLDGVAASVIHGSTLIKANCFEAEKILRLIDLHRCNVISGAESTYLILMGHPGAERYDLTSLKRGSNGGWEMIRKINSRGCSRDSRPG